MKIAIVFSNRRNREHGNALWMNLHDLAWNLDLNLRRRHNSALKAVSFDTNRMTLDAEGAERATVEPYLEAFRKSMMRHHKLGILISYPASD